MKLDIQIERLLSTIIASYQTSAGRGIAIGNLTSQILANVYLNELDRFVRHNIKPLGYVRYGDDFVMIFPDESSANSAAMRSAKMLLSELGLKVHKTNNVVIPVRRGVWFLGAKIFPSGTKILARTWRRIEAKIDVENLSGYYGLVETVGGRVQRDSLQFMSEIGVADIEDG
jgi:hypothetical protein